MHHTVHSTISQFLAADLECAVDSYWGQLCHPPGVLHIHPHAAHHPHHSLTRPLCPTHSLTHTLTHSLTRTLTHPHTLTHSLTPSHYSLTHSLTHPPTRPSTHPNTHSLTNTSNPSISGYVARHVRALYGTSKPVKLPRVKLH